MKNWTPADWWLIITGIIIGIPIGLGLLQGVLTVLLSLRQRRHLRELDNLIEQARKMRGELPSKEAPRPHDPDDGVDP